MVYNWGNQTHVTARTSCQLYASARASSSFFKEAGAFTIYSGLELFPGGPRALGSSRLRPYPGIVTYEAPLEVASASGVRSSYRRTSGNSRIFFFFFLKTHYSYAAPLGGHDEPPGNPGGF